MADLPERTRVRDAELLAALAHPLRASLLRYLMAVGARTASECAQAVGSTASNCSWHLRQLSRFGLVGPVEGGDGRQRPWRALVVGLELGELAEEPAMRAAQLGVIGTALREEQELTQRFLDRAMDLDPRWRESGGVNSYSLLINPDELDELIEAVEALVRPYVSTIRADAPDDARAVHVGFRAVPRIEADE